jgi:RNA polymerase sigma factor (TIGR02999 family)
MFPPEHDSQHEAVGPIERTDSDDVAHVTRLLREVAGGRPGAGSELLPLVYDDLRRWARRRLAGERPGHTLEATALVHEAYAKLASRRDAPWADRAHFFRAAAEAMRRILIDHARAKQGPVRGGDRQRVPLDLANVADLAARDDPGAILALDDAVAALERADPDAAAVVRLRFYAGLSVDETAEALDRSPRTVKRDWAFARAFLLRVLEGDDAAKRETDPPSRKGDGEHERR